MLFFSPSYPEDGMDRSSSIANPHDKFPSIDVATAFAQENMASSCFSTSLDHLSHDPLPFSSQFRQNSDILEKIMESDYLTCFADFSDFDNICSETSTSTSPSISPRSETEEVKPDRKLSYWNDYVTQEPEGIYDNLIAANNSITNSSLDSYNNVATSGNELLFPSTSTQNSDMYPVANVSNTIGDYTKIDELDDINLQPLEVDPETKMVCWSDVVIGGTPNVDPIISSSLSLNSSVNIMPQADNGQMCAGTSPLYTAVQSSLVNEDVSNNSPESYLNVDIKQEPNTHTGQMCAETSPSYTEVLSSHGNHTDLTNDPPESYLNVNIKQEPNTHTGQMCARTSPLHTEELSSLVNHLDLTNNPPESYLNVDIKQESVEEVQCDTNCVCGENRPGCDCKQAVSLDLDANFDFFTAFVLDDTKPDVAEVLIRPEHGDVALNNLPSDSKPLDTSLDINISCSNSVVLDDYSEDDYSNSFSSLEDSTIVNMSDICPMYDRNRVAEPFANYVLNFHNTLPRSLTPIDKVRNDHCYTKSEIIDEPAPLQAAMNYNYFLDGVNEIPAPVKRRPGRPRKSSVTVHVEKAKVVLQRAAQKRAKKATQVKPKKVKTQGGTAAECQKRILHNQAERDRRSALRDSMFSVAHRCPDHMLRLTEIALAIAKSSRSEDVENNFTVDVLRRVDELMKRSDHYDRKMPRSKKSPHYSKMVMLLGITYFVNSLDKDLKAKESLLCYKESIIRNYSSKYIRRFKRG